MDFIGGALPNIIFIVGIMAVGIGIGIEFKIVEIKAELTQTGRAVALTVGFLLIGMSIFLYTRPDQTALSPTSPVASPAALVEPNPSPNSAAAPASAPGLPTAPPVATAEPTAPPAAAEVALQGDPSAAFRALVLQAVADGQLDKKGNDLIKKLSDVEKEREKGKLKEAEEKLREMQMEMSKDASEGKLDASFAQQAIALLDQIIVSYGL
jgi:type IV secretory pathway VirB10-like protein